MTNTINLEQWLSRSSCNVITQDKIYPQRERWELQEFQVCPRGVSNYPLLCQPPGHFVFGKKVYFKIEYNSISVNRATTVYLAWWEFQTWRWFRLFSKEFAVTHGVCQEWASITTLWGEKLFSCILYFILWGGEGKAGSLGFRKQSPGNRSISIRLGENRNKNFNISLTFNSLEHLHLGYWFVYILDPYKGDKGSVFPTYLIEKALQLRALNEWVMLS